MLHIKYISIIQKSELQFDKTFHPCSSYWSERRTDVATIRTSFSFPYSSLGAYHDGQNNPCSSRDQFIMATSPGAVDETTEDNPYTFSYCSVEDFREFMYFLTLWVLGPRYRKYARIQWNLDLSIHYGKYYFLGGGVSRRQNLMGYFHVRLMTLVTYSRLLSHFVI